MGGFMKELVHVIEKCDMCSKRFRSMVYAGSKPCLEFKVYEDWIPEGDVNCVFIGESPPAEKKYFYNPLAEDNLRRSLFNILGIRERGYEGLCKFRSMGLFLTDAIKCRVNKKAVRTIPKPVIRNCLKILRLEIDMLAKCKNTKKIIVLGETARSALAMLGFEELRNYRVAKDCGRVVESKGFKIFLCTLPFDRNGRYWNKWEVKEKLKSFLNI